MSTNSKSSPPRLSIPKTTVPGVKSISADFLDMPSRISQDAEYSQDMFSVSPTMDSSNGFSSLPNWSLMMNSDISSASECTEESFDTKSLHTADYDSADYPFSLSQPMFHGSTGHDQTPLSVSEAGHSPQVTSYSQPHGYQMGFPFDTEAKHFPGGNNNQGSEDRDSMGFDSQWGQMPVVQNDLPGGMAQMSMFNPLPATPPHTDGSDVPMKSTSQASYPSSSYIAPEDAMFDPSLPTQPFSLGEPIYPLTPPLRDLDPNRTIRPAKQQRRSIMSHSEKAESDLYTPPNATVNQRFRDNAETKSPRDHPYYSLPTQPDGKYHCPFATGEKPCSHPPTTQKCAYHKYLDSHLKPYRCKVPQCVDAHFSSNACLFRHEREAHGMHGHGENPHLCLFSSCERSIPGNGFPRRWNLHDHMRRVHDYTASDKASSPEGSPVISEQSSKKKDNAVRKRKGTRAATATTMKRVRSAQSAQSNALKVAQAQANTSQQLAKAEKSYYECLARLQEELRNINPQDPALHDKANASLQELHTLGLNYRCIRAGQLAAERLAS
ncbi:hypothetical protein VTO42DRAFT_7212 [Malbranchea cinnamomea]